MTFAQPQFLFGLLLLPLAGLFLWWANKESERSLSRMGDRNLLAKLSSNVNWRGRRWRNILWFLSLASFLIALARPQWGSEVREIQQEGLQVMVALDVSQSMLAQDIKPSRLDRAKLEIADLTERLNGDEIGLVLFSGASFVQVPLTTDYFTALNYLESAGPNVISRPGTVIGDAIRTASSAFDQNQNSQKVLVLMTDGEDRETDPSVAAREAADEDVLIYTIGFGTSEGEPIPEINQSGEVVGYKQDQSGQLVLSQLDETTLQEIAKTGNGRYYRAGVNGRELDSLLAEIDQLQKVQLQTRYETRYIERYQIFLFLALVALIFSEFIPDRLGNQSLKPRISRITRKSRANAPENRPSWAS